MLIFAAIGCRALWSWAVWFFLVTGSWLSSIVFLSSSVHYFACIMTLHISYMWLLESNASWQTVLLLQLFACVLSMRSQCWLLAEAHSLWQLGGIVPILAGTSFLNLPAASLSFSPSTFLAISCRKCEFVVGHVACSCMHVANNWVSGNLGY